MRIYESPQQAPRSPLDLPADSTRDKEREAEERKRDTELAGEIAQRKKTNGERNVKLTVVLMASRRMLGECFASRFLEMHARVYVCICGLILLSYRIQTTHPWMPA